MCGSKGKYVGPMFLVGGMAAGKKPRAVPVPVAAPLAPDDVPVSVYLRHRKQLSLDCRRNACLGIASSSLLLGLMVAYTMCVPTSRERFNTVSEM